MQKYRIKAVKSEVILKSTKGNVFIYSLER